MEPIMGIIENCFVNGMIRGEKSVGGIVGIGSEIITNSHYNVDNVSINGRKILTVGGLFGSQYRDWISNDMALDITDYLS